MPLPRDLLLVTRKAASEARRTRSLRGENVDEVPWSPRATGPSSAETKLRNTMLPEPVHESPWPRERRLVSLHEPAVVSIPVPVYFPDSDQ
jgi:hypothetical protein